MTTTPSRSEAEFPPDLGSARSARRFVLSSVHLDDGIGEQVELLVSELASNVVLHARTPFTIRVRQNPDSGVLRIECHDGTKELPVLEDPDPLALTGRGLHIVDRLADRWGVDVDDDGKTVWFEISLEGHRQPRPQRASHDGSGAR